jgi:hypothetical protein
MRLSWRLVASAVPCSERRAAARERSRRRAILLPCPLRTARASAALRRPVSARCSGPRRRGTAATGVSLLLSAIATLARAEGEPFRRLRSSLGSMKVWARESGRWALGSCCPSASASAGARIAGRATSTVAARRGAPACLEAASAAPLRIWCCTAVFFSYRRLVPASKGRLSVAIPLRKAKPQKEPRDESRAAPAWSPGPPSFPQGGWCARA